MTMKRVKIEKIVESCRECDYFWNATYYCRKAERKLDTPFHTIPVWCPFETVR